LSAIIIAGALAIFFAIQERKRVLPSLLRLAVVTVLVVSITGYFVIPFVLYKAYISASPYLQTWKYDSYGANAILSWLLKGDLFDYGRLPVMTLLLVIGIAWALTSRSEVAILAVALFLFWLLIYFGRPTWGQLADLLPLHQGLLFHRFSAGVDLAAILLVGLGGEWAWRQCMRLPTRWAPMIAAALVLGLMVPAMRERYIYYSTNAAWMRSTQRALDTDRDAAEMIATLRTLPPGRTYAGLWSNWGNSMRWGDLRFSDLLTFNQIPAVSPPYQSLSLNSDLIWHFNNNSAADYSLFNVKYVVAPAKMPVTSFFTPIKKTSRYILYGVPGRGYEQFVRISDWRTVDTQLSLFNQNLSWMESADPRNDRFIRWSYLGADRGPGLNPSDLRGTAIKEKITPGRIDATIRTPNAATLVFKATYHPDWHVKVDGEERNIFMVSPSFIGVTVPPGTHMVSASYKSNRLKNSLLILSAAALILTLVNGSRLSAGIESIISERFQSH
jgi:Bacterial membrane protein YfhO